MVGESAGRREQGASLVLPPHRAHFLAPGLDVPLSSQWRTLEHSGVLFPPEYEPHGVKMKYDGASSSPRAVSSRRSSGADESSQSFYAHRQARRPRARGRGGRVVLRRHPRDRLPEEPDVRQELLRRLAQGPQGAPLRASSLSISSCSPSPSPSLSAVVSTPPFLGARADLPLSLLLPRPPRSPTAARSATSKSATSRPSSPTSRRRRPPRRA